MLQHFKKLDWILVGSVLLLVGVGLVSLYSSSLGRGNFLNFKKQVIFLGVGIFLMMVLSCFDWRTLPQNSYLILGLYLLCLLGLAGLFVFAPQIRGVKGWYKLGPFAVDPIEFSKIILIILLAKYFSMRHTEMYRISHILISGVYVVIPAALIFFQPDLGSALILLIVWLAILIISGIKIGHFLILLFCCLLIFIFSWAFLLRDYQQQRIISFILPELADPLGMGWSQNQARIAIGTGGIFGQGAGKGSQTQYGFLPEAQTDFIFAAIAEEFGLMGVSFLLLLFLILLWRMLKIAVASRANFPRLFTAGLATLLFCQLFINVGMNLGLLPIIGIPLPLVSYGGSSLIATCIGLGVLLSIKARQ